MKLKALHVRVQRNRARHDRRFAQAVIARGAGKASRESIKIPATY